MKHPLLFHSPHDISLGKILSPNHFQCHDSIQRLHRSTCNSCKSVRTEKMRGETNIWIRWKKIGNWRKITNWHARLPSSRMNRDETPAIASSPWFGARLVVSGVIGLNKTQLKWALIVLVAINGPSIRPLNSFRRQIAHFLSKPLLADIFSWQMLKRIWNKKSKI